MSNKYKPKHIENIPFPEFSQAQFISLANETLLRMDMHIAYINDNGIIAYTYNAYLDSATEIRIKVENGVAVVQSSSTGNEKLDMGKNKKYVAEFISNYSDIRNSISTDQLEEKYDVLRQHTFSPIEEIEMLPPATSESKLTKYLSFFVSQKGYFVTPIIVNINILIFIIMCIFGVDFMSPTPESILAWGANFRPSTLEREWWRLFTNFFIHYGIVHLVINMFALVYIGILLEPILGKIRFLFAYILTGLVASICSLWWYSFTVSAGASGAIFGMYGVFIAFLTSSIIDRTARKDLLPSVLIFVGYSLLGGLREGIDNAAHIGGLLSGLIIGYGFIPSLENSNLKWIKSLSLALMSIVAFSVGVLAYKKVPNSMKIYDEKMAKFVTHENMALEVYSMNEGVDKKFALYEIKNRGIYFWNENIAILDELDKLDLPNKLSERNKLLLEYCKLQIAVYEVAYKGVEEDRMEFYNNERDSIFSLIEEKVGEVKNLSQ